MSETLAYKIIDTAEWDVAVSLGTYAGSAVDLADGFIHLSTAEQLEETARKHFAGRHHLTLLTIDLTKLGESVVWEPSRAGALFPHIYGPLPAQAVIRAEAFPPPSGAA